MLYMCNILVCLTQDLGMGDPQNVILIPKNELYSIAVYLILKQKLYPYIEIIPLHAFTFIYNICPNSLSMEQLECLYPMMSQI